MLNNLHTHRTSCGVGMFRTGFRMPENAVLAGILAQLPTEPNGFFTSVRFVSPIPGTLQRDLADTFALTYTAREDSYVVDTRTRDVTVASDNLRDSGTGVSHNCGYVVSRSSVNLLRSR